MKLLIDIWYFILASLIKVLSCNEEPGSYCSKILHKSSKSLDTSSVSSSKKNLYDGRTKEARAFMKRIETLRAKRDDTFRGKVKESLDSFGNEYLLEGNVDILRKIVKNKQNMPIKMKDGKMKVDLFTASAFVQAIDKVKPDTKKKLEDTINNGSKAQFLKLLSVIMK